MNSCGIFPLLLHEPKEPCRKIFLGTQSSKNPMIFLQPKGDLILTGLSYLLTRVDERYLRPSFFSDPRSHVTGQERAKECRPSVVATPVDCTCMGARVNLYLYD
jgi:hypothetical protein